MNGLSPEDLEALHNALTTTSTSDAVTLIFVGILAVSGIIGVVLWILNTKLEPVKDLKQTLNDLVSSVNEMKGSLWTEESLNRLIILKTMQSLQDHERDCPCRKLYDKQMFNGNQANKE